jgi:ubiquilin
MMAQSQQMMTQNPEMMQQFMDSPMMQNLMNNPEMMRSMVRMNPQLNQMMEQRPELARMLEDPDVMRQSMQMIRNPSLMREMQRNSDRAIGRLDVMPGGHNAVVRAHEDVVDPLMTALTGSNEASGIAEGNLEAYAQQPEGSSNREALPNPWGPPAAPPAAVAATPGAAGPTASPFGAVAPVTGTQAANPMAGMMEQMMSNPAMMQQSMQMMNQMFGGQQANALTNPDVAPPASASPLTGAANPFAGIMQQMMSNPAMQNGGLGFPAAPPAMQGAAPNPFGGTMQQMMSNPAMMQQSMQMAQQMFGNQASPFGAAAATPTGDTNVAQQQGADAAVTDPTLNPFGHVQFAAQLAQLSAMGFCNQAACLRALQQHQGNVDAAIDTLLASDS